jgi:hypothetical protein
MSLVSKLSFSNPGVTIKFEIYDLPHGEVAILPIPNENTPTPSQSSIEKINS